MRDDGPTIKPLVTTDSTLMPFGNSRPCGRWLSRRDRVKIARRFNAGNQTARSSSPEGTVELCASSIELQPSHPGLRRAWPPSPALKRRPIFIGSLRDKCSLNYRKALDSTGSPKSPECAVECVLARLGESHSFQA